MPESPEERRDAALASIAEAGGVVLDVTPLATEDDPHTVAHYRLSVGAPDLATRSRLATVRRATEATTADLIPWTPAPEPEPVYEEPVWLDENGDPIPAPDEGTDPLEA